MNTTKKVTTKSKKDDVVTINIDPFLKPGASVISALIIGICFLIGANQIAGALGDLTISGGSDGTQTQATGTAGTTTAVTLDFIKDLYDQDSQIQFGSSDRDVLFVEVADPSCPYCHIAAGKNPELNTSAGAQFTLVEDGGTYVAPVPAMRELVEDGDASYMFIYTPGHGNGEMGTMAMYCAYEEDKFWDVHDLLYTAEGYALLNDTVQNNRAQASTLADFLEPAIDPGFMQDCLESGRYDSRITEDTSLAASMGVQGTPGYFVNETNFAGAYSYTDMEALVESLL